MSSRLAIDTLNLVLTNILYHSVFESALSRYLGKLSDKEKLLMKDCHDPETFAEYLSGVVRKHHESSSSRKVMDFCQPAIDGFRQFAQALDVFCNAKPDVLSVLWGGLRVVLRVAESFQEFFDAIVSSIGVFTVKIGPTLIPYSLIPYSLKYDFTVNAPVEKSLFRSHIWPVLNLICTSH